MGSSRSQLMHEVNERISEVLANFGSEDGEFVCECDEACSETVRMTLREYAARSEGELLLAPAHGRGVRSVSPNATPRSRASPFLEPRGAVGPRQDVA